MKMVAVVYSSKLLITNQIMTNTIKTQIESWMTTEAQDKVNLNYVGSSLEAPLLTITYGIKYAKILSRDSVWGFVALTADPNKQQLVGDLLKAASWKTPAKHSRGNILDGTAAYGPYGPTYLK
jgi:hypothetical protein